MCRLLGWAARTPVTAREVLGSDGLAAFWRLSRLHADGWGMADDGADGHFLQRSTARADTDPAFASATTGRVTRTAIVHLRWATPGLPVELPNTHPFRHDGRAFAHNGAIYPVESLGQILSPPWEERLQGTTDSERYFLAVLAELAEPGTEVPSALARVTGRLTREFRPTSLNALLSTPEALYAVSCHDPATAPGATPPAVGAAVEEAVTDDATYFDVQYRATPDAVIVASSGFVPSDADGWQVLPNDTVLVIDRDSLATREVALGSGLGAASAVGVIGPRTESL